MVNLMRLCLTGMCLLVLLVMPLQAAEDLEEQADFTLPCLGGGELSLSDLKGQWVVINYWATWCAPCRKEIPELSELHADRADITVLGLAFEDTDASVFEAFLEEYSPSYPILLPDIYQLPAALESPRVLPTSLLVNPDGLLYRRFLGPITRAELERVIGGAEDQAAP